VVTILFENPLVVPLLSILKKHHQSFSIHKLVSLLKEDETLKKHLDTQSHVDLYHTNFMVMNGLFQLQEQLQEEGLFLQISSMDITLLSSGLSSDLSSGLTSDSDSAPEQSLQLGQQNKLKDFYLDWSNCEGITSEQVQALLDEFWQRYRDQDKYEWALQILDLDNSVSQEQLQQRYRSLAQQHHPDKGGDSETFMQVREAYLLIKRAGA